MAREIWYRWRRCGKQGRDSLQWHRRPIGRDERIGTRDILYPKKRRYQAALHPFQLVYGVIVENPCQLLILWAVTRDPLKIDSIWKYKILNLMILYACKMYWGKKNPFLYSRIYCDKKALLVQFGRMWVSKTQCRRFKSYRAWFRINRPHYRDMGTLLF